MSHQGTFTLTGVDPVWERAVLDYLTARPWRLSCCQYRSVALTHWMLGLR